MNCKSCSATECRRDEKIVPMDSEVRTDVLDQWRRGCQTDILSKICHLKH